MPNILKRAITGFFILAVYLPLLILSPAFLGFFLLNFVLAQIAVFELARVFNLNQNKAKLIVLHILVFILQVATSSIAFQRSYLPQTELNELNLSIYLLSLVLTLVCVNITIAILYFREKELLAQSYFLVNFLALSFGGMIFLRTHHLLFALFPLIVTILTDTFAYLGGITFGKHKMSKISPKKSWEGFFIGTVFAAISTSVVYFLLLRFYYVDVNFFGLAKQSHPAYFILLFFAAFVFATIAQGGDLIFSAFKRQANVKDYSNILPGHGGVLDRVDALSVTTFLTFLIFLIYTVLVTFLLK